MENSLTVYILRLTAVATDRIELDEYAGSALRGALFQALLRRFCMNPKAATCIECELNPTCPVAGLVAPLRDERPGGRDVPRPFVMSYTSVRGDASSGNSSTATSPAAKQFAADTSLAFDLTLVGRGIAYLPYIALSTPVMESLGIGRPLRANAGRRGRFRVERIELVDPFSNATQLLFRCGDTRVVTPRLAITAEHVSRRAASLPANHLTLRFLSPTRLIAGGQLVRGPDLAVIVARLAERLNALTSEYAAFDGQLGAADRVAPFSDDARARTRELMERAQQVRLVADETRWVDVASYSARQKRSTPIGGLVGRAVYEGDLTPLRELLVWGELLHVGKNAVKGDGLYRIEA